jgi:hypothetical protein
MKKCNDGVLNDFKDVTESRQLLKDRYAEILYSHSRAESQKVNKTIIFYKILTSKGLRQAPLIASGLSEPCRETGKTGNQGGTAVVLSSLELSAPGIFYIPTELISQKDRRRKT